MNEYKAVSPQDFKAMTPKEKETYVFKVLGITEMELARVVAKWTYNHGKQPNALFVSMQTLDTLKQSGIILRKLLKNTLTVIPMDSKPDEFILSLEDPWNYGDLFYL